MKISKYLPINWVNGLKLTSDHFFASQNAVTETINREAGRVLTSYDYGLGEDIEGVGSNLEFDISGDTLSSVCVRLKCCNAITRGGLPIIYHEGMYGDAVPSAVITDSGMSNEDSDYVVLLSVDPYTPVLVGAPDPDEVPLHHPYVLPSIKIHIMPKNQVNKSFYDYNFLIIAEIMKRGNSYSVNYDYIPPVQRCGYHDGIKTFITQLSRIMRSINENVRTIYNRNISDRRRDTLADNTFKLCDAFSTFFCSKIFYIEQIAKEQAPIFLIQAINEFTNEINYALLRMPETERESLLQYYYEWTNVTPSEFLTRVEEVINIVYDHTEINRTLSKIGTFMTLVSRMFQKMSELEYIGLVRENIVVVDETNEEKTSAKKRSWSFMG